jgi:hypothetical protein
MPLAILLAVGLAACGRREASITPTFPAPTTAPLAGELQQTEVAQRTAENLPTPTPTCVSDLRFIEDITIPDGTEVAPGERLDKRWKVENAGTCNWDGRYHLKLIAGPDMGVSPQQALYPALSGTEAVIRMVFVAPQEPGSYRSAWGAFDPGENLFGETFFIDFVVTEVSQP